MQRSCYLRDADLASLIHERRSGNAAMIYQEKHNSDSLRGCGSGSLRGRVSKLLRETQTCVLQFDKGDAAFRLVKGRGLQDAAFEASHAISLEDLVGFFQCHIGI